MSKNNSIVGRRVVVRQVYGTTASDDDARRFVGRIGEIVDVLDPDATWPVTVRFGYNQSACFSPKELRYLNNRPVICGSKFHLAS